MFNADNGHRGKLMSREATDKLHAHMWECFQPQHGKGPWKSCRHYPVDPGNNGGHPHKAYRQGMAMLANADNGESASTQMKPWKKVTLEKLSGGFAMTADL